MRREGVGGWRGEVRQEVKCQLGGGGGCLTRPPRCMVDRCVSGMKRTGWVTWSSRLLKKVHSVPIELLTKPLLAERETSGNHQIRVVGFRGGGGCWD